MFKIILAVMVFTLAACSENSNKSTTNSNINHLPASESSDFTFIQDVNLRACLDESGMTVESVHTLVCSGKGVQSLEGMEQLPSLKNLNLSHNQLSDIEPLANLKGLQVLYATNNDIESVEALETLTELNAVSLRSNNLSDADVFYTLPQLEKLYVQGNADLDIDLDQFSEDVIVAI
jgi:Leucine-rich repeat (LRR) protein